MSIYQPIDGDFEVPSNPVPDEPLDIVAYEALRWIMSNIPYQNGSKIYRPEKATNGLRGGNCYAQAIGGAALLHEWGVDVGIVLSRSHAHLVAAAGRGSRSEIQFINPFNFQSLNHVEESDRMRGGNAARLYKSTLPKALKIGHGAIYFYENTGTRKPNWRAYHTDTVRDIPSHIDMQNPHVIADAQTGIDMLLACGDLTRYYRSDRDRYHEEYPNLISYVPAFIEFETNKSTNTF